MLKTNYKYPLRLGRKQRRAILDADGIEVAIFSVGSEDLAGYACDLLNTQHKVVMAFKGPNKNSDSDLK